MADISNKLNKASEDLSGTFVEITETTRSFSEALITATQSLADSTKAQANELEKMEKSLGGVSNTLKGIFSKAGGAFKKIPGLSKMAALGPLGAITGAATLLFKQLMQVSDTIASISKDTGLIGKQLKAVFKEVKLGASGLAAFNISLADAGKQAAALQQSLGNTTKVSAKLIDVTSRIAKAMGGSAQESAALADNLIRGFGKTAPQVEKFAESIMTFATKSGVNARKVMRDISNDSNLTSIYLSRGEDYMRKTAVMAAKMGKSMADNLATTDAFLNIESGSDLTARLNQFFGSNLNALSLYNKAVKQDTIGVMKELNKAISTPKGMAMIQQFPGIAKQLGAELGLNIKDMRQLGKVIKDMEKAAAGPTKEQLKLNDYIKSAMTMWEQLKGMVSSALLPLFTELGTMLHDKLKPLMNEATKMARTFGMSIAQAMDGAEGVGPKLKAAFVKIMETMGPFLDMIGRRVGSSMAGGIWDAMTSWVPDMGGAQMTSGINSLFGGQSPFQALMGAIGVSKNATGQVHSRPTLALVGEENRSEVVVPTERIRKGLPVSGSVSRELQSIGVPGFARGFSTASAAGVAASQRSQQRRSQQQMVYGSQGDPNAIKRREQKIEQQAAEDRAAQRALVNDIMKEQENLAREQYFSGGPGGAGFGGGGRGPGSPSGKGPGRDWGKTMHNLAKGLDNFMKLTNTTWKDMWETMPDKIQKPLEKFYGGLPENIKEGLTVGVETAWDHYLDTGNLQEALAMGAASGIRTATASGSEFQQGLGNIAAGMLEGQSFKKGMGDALSLSLNKKGNFLNTQLEKFTSNQEREAGLSAEFQGLYKDRIGELNKEAADAQKMYEWAQTDSGKQRSRIGADQYKKQMDEAKNMASALAKENRNEVLKSSAKQAGWAGAAAGLSAGVNTFAETGSFKEAGKSMLVSGGGAAVNAGVTAALSATPLMPIAPLLGSIAGSLASGGLSKIFGGGQKKPLRGAGARAKVIGGIAGAVRLAKKPGGEQLYQAFKSGSSLNKMALKQVDAAMMNSKGQMDEGLRGEMVQAVGSVISRATGVQLSSNEVLSFLAAIKGTGMQGHEQKQILTNFERKIEGVGARGAIVNRPTVALIGEAGPEAVTPLDQTPGNAPLGSGGGDLVEEIRQMNSLLKQVVTNPPPVNIDGQRVSRVLNSVNSDDIRVGVPTVNSRV